MFNKSGNMIRQSMIQVKKAFRFALSATLNKPMKKLCVENKFWAPNSSLKSEILIII